MHIVALRKVVQTGVHRAAKDKVAEVPDDIGKEWVASKLARPATDDEVKSGKPVPAKTEGK